MILYCVESNIPLRLSSSMIATISFLVVVLPALYSAISSCNRFNGIYGAAIAAKGIGDETKAIMYFKELLKLTENSNSNRPELKEAEAYVGVNNISS